MSNDDESAAGLVPFPTDERMFILGVEWQMFRQKLLQRPEAFAEFVLDEAAVWIVELTERFDRAIVTSSSDWPGWTYVKVGPASAEPFGGT